MAKKILVTLGPASVKKEVVEMLTNESVYLFRINLSHTKLEEVEDTIKKIVLKDSNINNWTKGVSPKKFIIVKGKIVNLVV